jgi:hypothetical protein
MNSINTGEDLLACIEHAVSDTGLEEWCGYDGNHNELKKRLGEFYHSKKSQKIPMQNNNIQMRVLALYDGVETNNLQFEDKCARPTVYAGVSGVGKTYHLLKHCTSEFCFYTTFGDNFEEVDKYADGLLKRLVLLHRIENAAVRNMTALSIVTIWLTVKVVCLTRMLQLEELTPKEFTIRQLNVNSCYFGGCFHAAMARITQGNFSLLASVEVNNAFKIAFTKLRNERPGKYGLCIDESQMLMLHKGV